MDFILITDSLQRTRSGAFSDNMRLPVHRWFRYSAGFSAEWVASIFASRPEVRSVLDPFAGSGTVLVEAMKCGITATGIEAHPFIFKVASAKLQWTSSPGKFQAFALETARLAIHHRIALKVNENKLLRKCFSDETLADLQSLISAWRELDDGSPESVLTWLALVGIVRDVASVGTAQWQYVLPNKHRAKTISTAVAFDARIRNMVDDMRSVRYSELRGDARLVLGDAREANEIGANSVDLILTSPPYANNYDYADATRLEMTVLGEIETWRDLQRSVRDKLIRSCSQHLDPELKSVQGCLDDDMLKPIAEELALAYSALAAERENHAGNKAYHDMAVHYFFGMSQAIKSMRMWLKDGGQACLVIGDSAPYGIHLPVDKWLGLIALSHGFKSFSFIKIRDRNLKWKNRKHRVPLQEGQLWLNG